MLTLILSPGKDWKGGTGARRDSHGHTATPLWIILWDMILGKKPLWSKVLLTHQATGVSSLQEVNSEMDEGK